MPYANFRRQAVPQQYAQALQTITFPAPTRGIVMSENEAYMQPGGANMQVNWLPTMRGVRLRGGFIRHCVLPERTPVISAFEYVSASNQIMFAANAAALYDVTSNAPVAVRTGHASGNYVATQMSNASDALDGTDWMLACTEAGDPVLRFNGTTWTAATGTPSDGATAISGPPGSPVEHGGNLSYVWRYKNRLYFIETGSMNAWYLPIDSVGGALLKIPLAGSATRGGHLLFGATWSPNVGDGADTKNVFYTSEGEALVFTGSDPSDANNWRQEGRYTIGKALGMNAHVNVGGDLLILTTEGIAPLSQAITREAGQLDLVMLTRTIKPLWRSTALARAMPWTIKRWDELGGMFVAAPGGTPGNTFAFMANNATAAWCQCTYDATCWLRLRADMFFGDQNGVIMQMERGGYDDGLPYNATLVGGWETFGSQANTIVWRQARASFHAGSWQSFLPQLSATTDYVVELPPPPLVGLDPDLPDVWDTAKWGPDMGPPPPPVPTEPEREAYAQWDQPIAPTSPVRNTMWVSIGSTGFAHAPIVQIAIGQPSKPDVELIAISAAYEGAGVNV